MTSLEPVCLSLNAAVYELYDLVTYILCPKIVLRTSECIHFFKSHTLILNHRHYFNPHFVDEETEGQRM